MPEKQQYKPCAWTLDKVGILYHNDSNVITWVKSRKLHVNILHSKHFKTILGRLNFCVFVIFHMLNIGLEQQQRTKEEFYLFNWFSKQRPSFVSYFDFMKFFFLLTTPSKSHPKSLIHFVDVRLCLQVEGALREG